MWGDALPASYDNWRMSGPDEYYHWDEDDEAEAEEDDRMTANEVRWEIWDLMDEEQVTIWRRDIVKGATCPICDGDGTIDSVHTDPEHGTSSLVPCPMCGSWRRKQSPLADEPAPF